MAEVTLGIGTSHSPMLSTPHEALAGLGDLDRGRLAEFDGKARASASWIARELTPEVTKARHEATQAAIQQLRSEAVNESAHRAGQRLVMWGATCCPSHRGRAAGVGGVATAACWPDASPAHL